MAAILFLTSPVYFGNRTYWFVNSNFVGLFVPLDLGQDGMMGGRNNGIDRIDRIYRIYRIYRI
ncbi:MAG: hypothetical protein ACPLYD_10605, partial [Anaerolineae bacterium]